MPDDVIYLTPEGKRDLERELHEMKTVRRPALVRAIAHARSLGDIAENAEYHSAKEAQAQLEARISELEERLSRSRVLDPRDIPRDTVAIHQYVTIKDGGVEETIQLVAEEEADYDRGKVSVSSPLGRALIGRAAGDEAEFETPRGVRRLRVVAISREKPEG